MKNKVQSFYIAYFDILGYKSFFEQNRDQILKFLFNIVSVAKDVKSPSYHGVFDGTFHIKTFSDNFIVLYKGNNKDDYQSIKSLSYFVALIQLRFLEKYSILIRGAITKGEAYIDENIVFGEGLIHAVELEKNANFPRIIIDDLRIEKEACEDLCEKCLKQDDDEKFYVNCFDVLGLQVGYNDEFCDQEEDHLNNIKSNIVKLIKKHGKFNQNIKDPQEIMQEESKISKYLWLITKFNYHCTIYYDESLVIDYDLRLNHRLMKIEIVLR